MNLLCISFANLGNDVSTIIGGFGELILNSNTKASIHRVMAPENSLLRIHYQGHA
jgi:hypothetical protein